MADINFDCPNCGHNLDVDERGVGLIVACPECSKSIVIPMPAPELRLSDIIFNCGSCRQSLKALPEMAGQLIDCPVCKKPTEIPFPPRPTPPTPTRPAARSTPIPKPPSQRQVPGTGTSDLFAPAAIRPPKVTSPGLVIAVIFLALFCVGLAAGMFFLIKNRNGGSTTAQGTPVAPTKENVVLARRTAEKETPAEKVLPEVDGNGGSTTAQGTPVVPTKENVLLARRTAEKETLAEKVLPDVTVTKLSAGPFGLSMGMKKDLFGDSLSLLSADADGGIYQTTKVPTPSPKIEKYVLRFGESSGLAKIRAHTTPIRTSCFGDGLKSEFQSLESAVTKKYGKAGHKFDFLRSGSIWNESRDWMMGLFQEERTLSAYWMAGEGKPLPDDISIIEIEAVALGTDVGVIFITYEFTNWSKVFDEMRAKADAAF